MLVDLRDYDPEKNFYDSSLGQYYQNTEKDREHWEEIKDWKYKTVSEQVSTGCYLYIDSSGEFLIERCGETVKSIFPWEPQTLEEFTKHPDTFISSYGVADNLDQVLDRYRDFISVPDRKFVIILTPVLKKDQPEEGGWRWHKWGEYIGTQNSVSEYLYDEPEIEEILLFHIYELE